MKNTSLNQPVVFQRIEGALIFLAVLFFYVRLEFNIWVFVLLLFSIDVFMIGYLKDKKTGAYIYNVGHSFIFPPILIVLGVITDSRLIVALGLIWAAHIGWDRAFGYGLKFKTDFKDTHLGKIGKK